MPWQGSVPAASTPLQTPLCLPTRYAQLHSLWSSWELQLLGRQEGMLVAHTLPCAAVLCCRPVVQVFVDEYTCIGCRNCTNVCPK